MTLGVQLKLIKQQGDGGHGALQYPFYAWLLPFFF